MRCIDADELIYDELTDKYGDTYLIVHAPNIDNAPTIDVQPVVHAEWKYYKNNGIYDYYKCSDCNFEVRILEDNIKELGNYCSHCGSRMDKE